MAALGAVFDAIGWLLIAYFIAINTSMLILTILASLEFVRQHRRAAATRRVDTFASPLSPSVSVLMPAYNEAAGIVSAVRAMSSLRYPSFEVLVIDDGSTDGTFTALAGAFDLAEVAIARSAEIPVRGEVLATYRARDANSNIVVVRKANGGKPDALNAGINLARHPVVCMVDADSLLDPDALLVVTRPFVDDPDGTVASGGVVRIANGCGIHAGRVVDARLPTGWLARIQVVEYLRAFLIGRTGWARLRALLIISGAFAVFRRDELIALGGLAHDTMGEDAEIVVRLHRRLAEQGREGGIVFVPEPVCWTEVPTTLAVLRSQRERWHRGIAEIMLKHRDMILRPRYGRIGMLAMPWFLLFEVLAPLLELVGVAFLAFRGGVFLLRTNGILEGPAGDPTVMWLLLGVSWGYALLLSVLALALEELTFRRYSRRRDLVTAFLAAILENFGYRQLTAWWRVQGLLAAARKSKPEWGVMTRIGLADTVPSPKRPKAPRRLVPQSERSTRERARL